jgi:acetyl esterase/lipase
LDLVEQLNLLRVFEPIMHSLWTTIGDSRKLVFYTVLQKGFLIALWITRSRLWSPKTQPDAIKYLPLKPSLFASRVFRPAGQSVAQRLPLIVQIHGGGFIVNNPSADDELARFLADTCKCLVVSIDYRKAPQNIFPAAYEDIVDSVEALIQDASLNVRPGKVVLSGNSAGGNLALAAAQDPRIHPNIAGVLGLYPVCDGSIAVKEKLTTRPDPSVPDILESGYDDLLRLYVGSRDPGQDVLQDYRFSPAHFKSRGDLPSNIYLIGAEHDMLCAEALSMAERLALGIEKRKTKYGWEADGIKWDLVPDQLHGFDQFNARGKQYEATRLDRKAELYQSMADWIVKVLVNDA